MCPEDTLTPETKNHLNNLNKSAFSAIRKYLLSLQYSGIFFNLVQLSPHLKLWIGSVTLREITYNKTNFAIS